MYKTFMLRLHLKNGTPASGLSVCPRFRPHQWNPEALLEEFSALVASNICYLDSGFSWFLSVPAGKCQDFNVRPLFLSFIPNYPIISCSTAT